MQSAILTFLKNNATVLILAAGFLAYVHYNQPAPPPEAPLTVAAREYLRALPRAYEEVRDGVRAGRIKSRDEIIALANSRAAEPMANALMSSLALGCDSSSKNGAITNPSLVAAALDDVVKGLK